MKCDKCGQEIDGILAWAEHPCNVHTIEYREYTDVEIREFFMEIGMPEIGYEALGYAIPTETEKRIFEDNRNYEL